MNGGGHIAESVFEIVICRRLTYISCPGSDKYPEVDLYVAKGFMLYLFIMSSQTSHSSDSHSIKSSSAIMTSNAAQPSLHPYLTHERAATVSSWQSSLQSQLKPSTTSDTEAKNHQDIVDAYQQLKLALFARTRQSTSRLG